MMNRLDRRDFMGFLGAGLLALISPGALKKTDAMQRRPRRPNILFIITDDQGLDTFGFINKKALTPNIDRLAAEGVYFSRAYASSSVCTPSRYTCLTGRYASRSKDESFLNNISSEGQTSVHWNTDLVVDETNVARTLKNAGYATGVVGKLHGFSLSGHSKILNKQSDPRDPQVIKALREDQKIFAEDLKEHGFDFAERLNRNNLGSTKALPDELCKHSPEWVTEGALKFIEQNKDRPFYLYFATTLLHGPSPLESLKSDPRITEAGYLDEPPKVQPSRASVLKRVEEAGLSESMAPATWLDDSIGAMLNKLDELGIAEDTLIIYFNDHGHEGSKGALYEGGVRTPTIIRWPGKVKHGQSKELIENIDFVPTILSAAGAKAEDMVTDGMDLSDLLTKGKSLSRDSLLCEIGNTRAVVTERWKYIAFRIPPSVDKPLEERKRIVEEYLAKNPARLKQVQQVNPQYRITHINRQPGGDGTELGQGLKYYAKHYFDADQLYNLENDPGEQKNLAKDPGYKDVLEEMKAKLKKHLENLPGTFAEFKKS
jgi:arylsulfatase A-like enzyme